jgi:hypothetical protein
MTWNTIVVAGVLTVMSASVPADAKDPDERLWDAVRKGKVAKVRKLLDAGTSPETRTVALSTAVSHDRPETFRVLWERDNADISPETVDFALCYAYRVETPDASIQAVLDDRRLTVDACCRRNRRQEYCAGRPIRLTSEEFAPVACATVYTDERQVPAGATPVAELWDERTSMLDSASSARYGPPELSERGARSWALEFAPVLGKLGADAILITVAETVVDSASSFRSHPTRGGGATVEAFVFGTVTDRIELVAIRTRPPD